MARLLAGMGMHCGTGGADDLALLHRHDAARAFAHFKEIGRDEIILHRLGLRRGQGGVGGSGVEINLAIGKHQHPAGDMAIQDIAGFQAVGGEHLDRLGHGGACPMNGAGNQDLNIS